MSGPGRRVAIAVIITAATLTAGHALAGFLADRMWESSISSAAAVAGLRRSLLALVLEATIALFTASWLALHWGTALRIALPWKAVPGDDGTRIWPRTVPRWSVLVAAVLVGLLVGEGGARLTGFFQLYLDGTPVGIRDPWLEEDLGTFLGSFPFWSALQSRAVVLCLLSLGGAATLYVLGGLIDRVGRRIRISPRARGQLAVLVALLALSLAWGASLEPLRVASGQHGPVRHAEFLLRAVMAYLQTGLGVAAAVVSLLCWVRIRGSVALLFWVMFGLAWLGGEFLPLHPELARKDPVWQSEVRRVDSMAFRLTNLDGVPLRPRARPAALPVSLWDDSVAIRAGLGSLSSREWLSRPAPFGEVPVWLGSGFRGAYPAILALADDRVSPSGAPLFWSTDSTALSQAPQAYWLPESGSLRMHPGAPRVALRGDSLGSGVTLLGLPRRIVLAWAWQFLPAAGWVVGRPSRCTTRSRPAASCAGAICPLVHAPSPPAGLAFRLAERRTAGCRQAAVLRAGSVGQRHGLDGDLRVHGSGGCRIGAGSPLPA